MAEPTYRQRARTASQDYSAGEISYPEFLLENTGIAGSMFGDALGQLVPEFISDPIAQGVEYLAQTEPGQYVGRQVGMFQQNYPRTSRNIGNLLSTAELAPIPAVASSGRLFAKNLPNNMPEFYTSGAKASKQIADSPLLSNLASRSDRAADLTTKGVKAFNRYKAMGKGFAKGISNTIKQSVSPQLLAEFRQRDVSKTLLDLAKDPDASMRTKWGQTAFERQLAGQYGTPSPLLRRLDNDYYTHEGVFSFDNFKEMTGLSEVDAQAFFRTSVQNWKIKPTDDFVMFVRQPKGTEGSGDLYDAAFFESKKAMNLSKVFEADAGFNDGDEFLRFYDSARLLDNKEDKLTPEKRDKIKQVFDENVYLSTITDPNELAEELQKLTKFGVSQAVTRASKYRPKRTFNSNDELAEAMESKGYKVLRNRSQENNRDVYFVDSVTSDAMELGGVQVVYKVSPDGTVMAQITDINDLEGIGAPGAMKAITVTPPLVKNVANPSRTRRSPQSSTALKDIMSDLQLPAQATGEDIFRAYVNRAALAAPVVSGTTSAVQQQGEITPDITITYPNQ